MDAMTEIQFRTKSLRYWAFFAFIKTTREAAAILNRPQYANVNGWPCRISFFLFDPKKMMSMIDLVTSLLDCFVSFFLVARARKSKK